MRRKLSITKFFISANGIIGAIKIIHGNLSKIYQDVPNLSMIIMFQLREKEKF
jgi:hypothetical protein